MKFLTKSFTNQLETFGKLMIFLSQFFRNQLNSLPNSLEINWSPYQIHKEFVKTTPNPQEINWKPIGHQSI